MKKCIKNIWLVFFVCFFILSINVYATENSMPDDATNCLSLEDMYNINSYNVKINIGENNVFEVEEAITVNYFRKYYGGIEMTISKEMELTKNDGNKVSKIAKISNIQTNVKASINDDIDKLTIKFGEKDEAVEGTKTYIVKYTCNLGKDPFIDYDEFYFYIFNNRMKKSIYNASFEIIMPKEFNEEELKIYSNYENSNIKYKVEGNKIKGFCDGELKSEESIVIDMLLPEGYFFSNEKRDKCIFISLCAFSILGVFFVFLMWKKYGDDDTVVKKKVKTPPKKLTPAELGFFLKGQALREDMLTIFLSLANKGYIKFEETEEEILFTKSKSFKVMKIKDYTEKNKYEKALFHMIFASKGEITEKELRKILNTNLKEIENKLESKENIRKVFEDTGNATGMLALSVGISVLLLTLAVPMHFLFGKTGLIISMFLVLLEVLAFCSVKAIPEYDYSKRRNFVFAIVLLIEFLFFIIIPVITVTKLFYFDLIYKIIYCIGLVCFAIIIFIRRFMAKRTKWGIELLGEVEGFREYLLNDKEIEKALEKDEKYLYEILP